ncbi:MAG: PD-(D/E)XK nuclease-like domain-containing protein [Ilumatobacteraceae bacterium]
MNVEQYRAVKGYSYSTLKAYIKSPLHGATQEYPPQTPAMRFGIAVDLILKGQRDDVIINPFDDGRTKAAKEFKEEHKRRCVLSGEEMKRAEALVAAVLNNSNVKKMCLDMATPDEPLFGRYDDVPIKGLPDWKLDNILIDLKTTGGGVDAPSFAKAVESFHYDLQAAMYSLIAEQMGAVAPEFFWIVVESDTPFDVAVYKATPEIIEVGRRKFARAIKHLKMAQQGDLFGQVSEIKLLSMPPWYGRDFQE